MPIFISHVTLTSEGVQSLKELPGRIEDNKKLSRRIRKLEQLAADCVSAFDCFRAPLTREDRARRNPAKLTPRQRDYLDRWGYPYVMEEFRFHMTLTGRLETPRREPIVAMLQDRFADLGIERLAIDRLVLFRQNDNGSRFHVIGHWPLRAV